MTPLCIRCDDSGVKDFWGFAMDPCDNPDCEYGSANLRRMAMQSNYLRPGFDFALAHAVEEAGEFLAAAGKTQRWGRDSYNPELAVHARETNESWLRREMDDLRAALERLETALNQQSVAA